MINKVFNELAKLFSDEEESETISAEDFDIDPTLVTYDEDEAIGFEPADDGEGFDDNDIKDGEEAFDPLAIFQGTLHRVDDRSKFGDDACIVRTIVNLHRIRGYGKNPIPKNILYDNLLCPEDEVDRLLERVQVDLKSNYNIEISKDQVK